ncbi:ArsA family ATPase [Yinghuangia seranimata]|uniref:ArsA family ATPase n=1 Tax=Yinghuangia seranimata TaxID=408067 RepID=UPI00248B82FD|nr:ArsA-related P-loop ATPase [Yinghuangia seranimata]MDI2126122.1 ArsA-related P-loop ATPase [Yinghuangia seranimata]
MTRVLLVTGPGGAGRTTVAAATAAAAARDGQTVLLLAADGTADADTVLAVELTGDPVEVWDATSDEPGDDAPDTQTPGATAAQEADRRGVDASLDDDPGGGGQGDTGSTGASADGAAPRGGSGRSAGRTRGGDGPGYAGSAGADAAREAGRRGVDASLDDGPDGEGQGDTGSAGAAAGEPGVFFAARVAVQEEFEREFLLVQEQLRGLLALVGVDPLDAEEITAVPGAADALALRALARHAGSGEWDLIVVDLPPVDRTALALALPESLARYLDRLLPVERQAARSLRPVLAAVAGLPMPDEWVYDTARRVIAELDAIRAVVDGPDTAVRLVTRAGTVAAAADRRAASALALYGRRVDDVVVNGGHFGGEVPPERVAALGELFPSAAVTAVPALDTEPVGLAALLAFAAALPPTGEGGARPADGFAVEQDGDRLILVVPLPGADRGDLDLLRRGDELVVTVGAYRRLIPLPSALRRCTIEGAGLRAGTLRVRFVPDPAVWMRT